MHWCTEQMIAGYKRNSAEEPTDQNRGNLLGEPKETDENGGYRMKVSKEFKELFQGIAWGLLYFITVTFAMLWE